jgi:hypothetical protein
MNITSRDLSVFREIARYGALTTAQLGKLCFQEIARTTELRRLRKLEEYKLVRKASHLPDGMATWFLTPQGAMKVGLEYIPVRIPGHQLTHDMRLNDVRMSLEGVGLGNPWVSERELRKRVFHYSKGAQDPQIIPDALFSKAIHGVTYAVALELELQEKSRARYKKIFETYLKQKNLGFVWYLVESESFGNRLLNQWRGVSRGLNSKYGYSLVSEILSNPLQANIFRMDRNYLLHSFFDLKPEPISIPSAQAPAQGLSRREAEKPNESKSENPNQIRDQTPAA